MEKKYKIIKLIMKVVFFLIIFITPFIISKIILHIPDLPDPCFSIQVTKEPNPLNQQKFSSPEFENLFKSKLNDFERIDDRLLKIAKYDLYFINKTVTTDEYKNEKLPTTLICGTSKDTERQFTFNIPEKIGNNLNLSEFNKAYQCEGMCAVFTISARTLQPGETQNFPIGFKGCLLIKATKSSYWFVYFIIFSLFTGFCTILREGIKIVHKNWRYFVD